jgi:hypothetical protein
MNFEFIERGETRDKVVKFGWVGITDEKVVNNKGKRGGVGVMAEEHGGGGFGHICNKSMCRSSMGLSMYLAFFRHVHRLHFSGRLCHICDKSRSCSSMVLFTYVPRSCHWTIDQNMITINIRCLGSVSLPFGGTSTRVKAFAGTQVVATVGFSIGGTCKPVKVITVTHPVY